MAGKEHAPPTLVEVTRSTAPPLDDDNTGTVRMSHTWQDLGFGQDFTTDGGAQS